MSDQTTDTSDKKLPKDLAAEQGLVNVQIDGHWIQVPKGTRMIEACKQAEKEVPHYCYHPKLSSPGNCRMCLVQMGMPPRLAPGQDPDFNDEGFQDIGWMPRPVIACANTVAENMGIRTSGELVEECRNGVMEFLLINHPLDCPICDQAGECRLQEFSVEHGRGHSRFVDTKIKKPKNVDIGKNIRLDDERCIMCSRCIRFMDEVADEPVLGFSQRGTHTTLTVHPGKRLDNNYSLNTADLCPVGALTSNDFRFKQRVWFLKETNTIDTNCGTGANITVWTRGNEIHRVTPRENNEVNSSWIPDSHRLGFHHLTSEKRLTAPLLKTKEGQHAQTSWSDALGKAAAALRSHQPGEVAIIASARLTNEELLLAKALADSLGTDFLATVPRIGESDGKLISADRNPNTVGAAIIFDQEDPAHMLDAIREGVRSGRIKVLFSLQENLLKEAGFEESELAKLDTLISTHILANPTAALSDLVLPGAGSLEKSGTMVNVTGRLQRLNRAIAAPGQARPDHEILHGIVKLIQKDIPLEDTPASLFKFLSENSEKFKDSSLFKIGEQGLPIVETGVTIPLIEQEKEKIKSGEING